MPMSARVIARLLLVLMVEPIGSFFFVALAEDLKQREWQQSFVKGVGCKTFAELL